MRNILCLALTFTILFTVPIGIYANESVDTAEAIELEQLSTEDEFSILEEEATYNDDILSDDFDPDEIIITENINIPVSSDFTNDSNTFNTIPKDPATGKILFTNDGDNRIVYKDVPDNSPGRISLAPGVSKNLGFREIIGNPKGGNFAIAATSQQYIDGKGYIQYDFGNEITLDRMQVYFANGTYNTLHNYVPKQYRVDYSDDGITWEQGSVMSNDLSKTEDVGDIAANAYNRVKAGNATTLDLALIPYGIDYIFEEPFTARYFRFVIILPTQDSYIDINGNSIIFNLPASNRLVLRGMSWYDTASLTDVNKLSEDFEMPFNPQNGKLEFAMAKIESNPSVDDNRKVRLSGEALTFPQAIQTSRVTWSSTGVDWFPRHIFNNDNYTQNFSLRAPLADYAKGDVWMQIDLGKNVLIDRIEMTPYMNGNIAVDIDKDKYPKNIRIDTGVVNDKGYVVWKKGKENKYDMSVNSAIITLNLDNPESARFYKIVILEPVQVVQATQINGNVQFDFYNFKMYGEDTPNVEGDDNNDGDIENFFWDEYDPNTIIIGLRNYDDIFMFSDLLSNPLDGILNGIEYESTESLLVMNNNTDVQLFSEFNSTNTTHEQATEIIMINLSAGQDILEVINILNNHPKVAYAQPNYKYYFYSRKTPNDADYSELWGIDKISAPLAWNKFTGSDTVVVGVVDTGIDYNHPDLSDNIWKDANGSVIGWDCYYNTNDPMDYHYYSPAYGHGTHVAGTIGAVGNNGIGVTGVNWNVKLSPLNISNRIGEITTMSAIRAINFAINMDIPILNNSWGGGTFDNALYDAIDSYPGLFIAAAGNSSINNDNLPHYPSSFNLPNIISVASSDPDDSLSYFSNYGRSTVHLAAPGKDIYSTFPNNEYMSFEGTSMAAPHVAGAAALILGADPTLSTDDLKGNVLKSIDSVSALSGKVSTGGRLNVNKNLYVNTESSNTSSPVLSVVYDNGQANISWTLPEPKNPGASIVYDIYVDNNYVDETTGNNYTFNMDEVRYGASLFIVALEFYDSEFLCSTASNIIFLKEPKLYAVPSLYQPAPWDIHGTSITMTWPHIITGDGNIVNTFNVYVDGRHHGSTSGQTYELTGLTMDTQYTLQIEAVYKSQTKKSDLIYVTTRESEQWLTAPVMLGGATAGRIIGYSWSPSYTYDRNLEIVYDIYENNKLLFTTQGTNFQHGDFSGNPTDVYVEARVEGIPDLIKKSNTITICPPVVTPAKILTPKQNDITTTSIKVSWEDALVNGEINTATNYTIIVKKDDTTVDTYYNYTPLGKGYYINIPNLTPDTDYQIIITSVYGITYEDSLIVVRTKPISWLSVPQLTVDYNHDYYVAASWTSAISNTSYGQVAYNVYVNESLYETTLDTFSYGIPIGFETQFNIYVEAYYTKHPSVKIKGNTVYGKTLPSNAPSLDPIKIYSPEINFPSITINWDDIGAQYYMIMVYENDDLIDMYSIDSCYFTYENLKEWTSYEFAVMAVYSYYGFIQSAWLSFNVESENVIFTGDTQLIPFIYGHSTYDHMLSMGWRPAIFANSTSDIMYDIFANGSFSETTSETSIGGVSIGFDTPYSAYIEAYLANNPLVRIRSNTVTGHTGPSNAPVLGPIIIGTPLVNFPEISIDWNDVSNAEYYAVVVYENDDFLGYYSLNSSDFIYSDLKQHTNYKLIVMAGYSYYGYLRSAELSFRTGYDNISLNSFINSEMNRTDEYTLMPAIQTAINKILVNAFEDNIIDSTDHDIFGQLIQGSMHEIISFDLSEIQDVNINKNAFSDSFFAFNSTDNNDYSRITTLQTAVNAMIADILKDSDIVDISDLDNIGEIIKINLTLSDLKQRLHQLELYNNPK